MAEPERIRRSPSGGQNASGNTPSDQSRRVSGERKASTPRRPSPLAGRPAAGNQSSPAPSSPVSRRPQAGNSGMRSARPAGAFQASRRTPAMPEGDSSVMPSLVKAIVYIILIIISAIFLAYFIIVSANDIFAFVKPDEEISVTIPENATMNEVTDILSDSHVIQYPTLFKMYAKLKKDNGVFLAGDYTVSPSMNYDSLLSAFKPSFSRKTVWVTIPEGYCVEDIIRLLTSKGIASREEFIDAINNIHYDYDFLKPLYENTPEGRTYLLEGYLYPDKYEFYVDSSAETVIDRFLQNFNEKFDELFYQRAQELNMTIDEVLTIASMIQSEAYYLDEYEVVSSVFHNRLNNPANFPRLESDATVYYAITCATGSRPETLTSDDLAFDSPYNTRLYRGLPPGPICSPSYNAITCALYPADTDYYYFFSNSQGRMTFSRTLSEHLAGIRNME